MPSLVLQAAIEALRVLPFSPGEDTVIVCNDWHTALVPVLLKVIPPPPPSPSKLQPRTLIPSLQLHS